MSWNNENCRDPRWMSDYELRNQLRDCERDRCGCEDGLREELRYREWREEMRREEEQYEQMLVEQARERRRREEEQYIAEQQQAEHEQAMRDEQEQTDA